MFLLLCSLFFGGGSDAAGTGLHTFAVDEHGLNIHMLALDCGNVGV
jgi:hypothetical protein